MAAVVVLNDWISSIFLSSIKKYVAGKSALNLLHLQSQHSIIVHFLSREYIIKTSLFKQSDNLMKEICFFKD